MIALASCAGSAQAAFPGQNGKITYARSLPGHIDVFSVNPDGTDETDLTNSPSQTENYAPHWSADGQRIIFYSQGSSGSASRDIFVMNADGSGLSNLTNSETFESEPAWSPDGWRYAHARSVGTPSTKQVFTVGLDGSELTQVTQGGVFNSNPVWSPSVDRIAYEKDGDIYVGDIDGTDPVDLTNTESAWDGVPDWSPDGRKLAFESNRSSSGDVFTIDSDGHNLTRLTSLGGINPAWSPDGTKIAFESAMDGGPWGLFVMNANGSDPTRVGGIAPGAREPDWQPVPVDTPSTYARPAGATPLRASLVPAFVPCSAPNRTHGAPLAFGSCTPPLPYSGLTLGVGDGSPADARGIGSLRIDVQRGTPGPPDESDLIFRFRVTNVMQWPDLSDYTGLLRVAATVRLTDRVAGAASTAQDFRFAFDVPCTATSDTAVGSTCALTTTADALRSGSVVEGDRATWELGPVRVYDGGPEDGDVGTDYDNQPFLVQGVFVP